jgi:hypothetical protein
VRVIADVRPLRHGAMAQPARKDRTDDDVAAGNAPTLISMAGVMEVAPTEGTPEFHFDDIPVGAFSDWTRFATYLNDLEAHIVAGNLLTNGVPSLVERIGYFPSATAAAIWVPRLLAHRARWVLSWPPPSEAELTFLATGELPSHTEQHG